MKPLSILLPLLISGCATTIDKQVAGFPQDMRISVHKNTPQMEIFKRCYSGIAPWRKWIGTIPLACAWIDLDKKTCDIYVAKNVSADIMDHELQHCKGGDHDGILQRLYDDWNKDGTNGAS